MEKTIENLTKAFIGESQARNRYTFYSKIAKKEGFEQIAEIFLITAENEKEHVNWKILARLDRPIVKTYRNETELPVYLLLDASASMQFGNPPKWQLATQLATSLGYIALCGGDALFAIALSEGNVQIAPLRGKGMFFSLLRWLKNLKPEGKGLAEGLIKFAKADLPKGFVVLLTDGLDENFPDALHQTALRGHEVLLLQILSDVELEPALEGDLRLLDCETEEAVEITATSAVMHEYQRRLTEFCQRLSEICFRAGGWYLRLTSGTSLSEVIFHHLRRLGVVGLP